MDYDNRFLKRTLTICPIRIRFFKFTVDQLHQPNFSRFKNEFEKEKSHFINKYLRSK